MYSMPFLIVCIHQGFALFTLNLLHCDTMYGQVRLPCIGQHIAIVQEIVSCPLCDFFKTVPGTSPAVSYLLLSIVTLRYPINDTIHSILLKWRQQPYVWCAHPVRTLLPGSTYWKHFSGCPHHDRQKNQIVLFFFIAFFILTFSRRKATSGEKPTG